MKMVSPAPAATGLKIAFGVLLFAAATGAAFAAWVDNGAGIFLSLVEAGISWCF